MSGLQHPTTRHRRTGDKDGFFGILWFLLFLLTSKTSKVSSGGFPAIALRIFFNNCCNFSQNCLFSVFFFVFLIFLLVERAITLSQKGGWFLFIVKKMNNLCEIV
ncbi:hypothetical protein ACFFRR_004542 [Megaselia abdita]